MTVLAIQEILRQQKTLKEVKKIFKMEHNLKVREHLVSGKKVVVLTRDPKLKYTSVVQDEASLVIIDEDLNIVTKGFDRLYKTSTDYVGITLLHNNDRAITVQEWLEGPEIVISKVNNTFLISTKDDINGHPYSKIVMDIIDKKFPEKGLDELFDHKWVNNISWIFKLVKHTSCHKLYLIGGINLKNLQELNTTQIDNIAKYLNLKTFRHQNVYTKKQLEDTIHLFLTSNTTSKYVIVKDEEGNRFKIPIKKYSKSKLLTHIAKCIIEHDQSKLNNIDTKYNELVSLIQHRFHTCTLELCQLFTKNKNVRTRKIYANNVKHHPFAAAIFALKDKKISGFYNMKRVIKPIDLLNVIEEKDHTPLYKLLNEI